MQSVTIATNVVSSNSAQGEVYSIQHYVTGDRSVVLSSFFHQQKWLPQYKWNFDSGIKHHNPISQKQVIFYEKKTPELDLHCDSSLKQQSRDKMNFSLLSSD